MAAFAAKTFNATGYLSARPVYPKQLYDTIFSMHRGEARRAVDLGAGSGQVTRTLVTRISDEVVATDPSAVMIEQGKAQLGEKAPSGCSIDWKVGTAESLSWIPDESVDLIVSGQAAHWFDHSKVWPELRRILAPKGTVAYWGYGDMVLPQFPSTRSIISQYMYDDPTKLGPHWQQPGRDIVCGLYKDIPWPADQSAWDWTSRRRLNWTGDQGQGPLVLRKDVNWVAFEDYTRTFSSLHNFQVANPDDEQSPEGDIVVRFVKQVKDAVARSSSDGSVPETFELAWPLSLMSISRA